MNSRILLPPRTPAQHAYLTHTRLGRNTVGEGGGWGGEGRHRPRILSAPPSRCPSSTLFGSTAHSCTHIRHCLHMLVRTFAIVFTCLCEWGMLVSGRGGEMVRWAQYITGLAHTRAICHQKLLLASGVMGEPHGCSGLGVPRTERVHTGGCLSGRGGVWSGRLGRPARGSGRTIGGGRWRRRRTPRWRRESESEIKPLWRSFFGIRIGGMSCWRKRRHILGGGMSNR